MDYEKPLQNMMLFMAEEQSYLEKSLDNFLNVQFFTTLYFGTQHEPHKLIFDTGSSVSAHHNQQWIWLSSVKCSSCPKTMHGYNEAASDDFFLASEE